MEAKISNNQSSSVGITLTEAAVKRYREMMKENGQEGYALRIRVVSGGCSGMQYEMGFEAAPQEDDIVVESSGQKIFVDSRSVPFLSNLNIDYSKGLTQAGFRITNPQAKGTCGCGESFS